MDSTTPGSYMKVDETDVNRASSSSILHQGCFPLLHVEINTGSQLSLEMLDQMRRIFSLTESASSALGFALR